MSRDNKQNVKGLTKYQQTLLKEIVSSLQWEGNFTCLTKSNIFNRRFCEEFLNYLRVHHCISEQPITKDRFEYAILQILRRCGLKCKKAKSGNPGHDLTINRIRFSVKTQADKKIKLSELHISKFMELGKGNWRKRIRDLHALRNQFIAHLKGYEKIISLRIFRKDAHKAIRWEYELVEIPKNLLLEATQGTFSFAKTRNTGAGKNIAPSGYCKVFAKEQNLKFELYFDGKGERKLQIKKLQKSECQVLAKWSLTVPNR